MPKEKYTQLGIYDAVNKGTEEESMEWFLVYRPMVYFGSEFSYYNKLRTPIHIWIQSVQVDASKHSKEKIQKWLDFMEKFKVDEKDAYHPPAGKHKEFESSITVKGLI